MTQQQLEKYLWGAATLLRGTIDAGDYKQYIFPAGADVLVRAHLQLQYI